MKKYLKFLLVAALAVVMMTSLTACGQTGTYKLKEAQVQGITLSSDMFEAYGISGFTITLDKGGKGSMSMAGETIEITWGGGKIKSDNNEEIAYTIKGKQLKIEMDGATLVFEK